MRDRKGRGAYRVKQSMVGARVAPGWVISSIRLRVRQGEGERVCARETKKLAYMFVYLSVNMCLS